MDHQDCSACPLEERRSFLRNAALTVGSVLLTLGFSGSTASALDISKIGNVAPLPGHGNPPNLKTFAIPQKDGVQIDRDNGLIIVRWLDAVYAFALSCPHQNTNLTWLDKDEKFQCPKHRSQYAPDGFFITGRATRGMDRYAVQRQGDSFTVDMNALKKEDDDAEGWKAAQIDLTKKAK